MRRTLGLITVLVLVWQALASVSPYQVATQGEDIAHAVVHAQALDHHHPAELSLQLPDDSLELSHQHANEAAQPVGLLPTDGPAALAGPPHIRLASPPQRHTSAYLDRLLRPPQQLGTAG